VDAGTNQLGVAGGLGTGANLNINAGAVFDVTPLGATTYTLDTKALSANGTGTVVGSTASTIMADPAGTVDFASKPLTLTFTPASTSGDSGHPALFAARGTMSFNGNAITVSNAFGAPLGAGTYQLVHQASGSIISSGAFVTLFNGSALGAGLIGEIVAVGGDLNLVVSAYTPKSLVWTGGDPSLPNIWDRLTTTNWLAGATPSTFNIYDGVTFNSVGSTNPVVYLATTMAPSSVTVDTSANNYAFITTGSGQIAGGAVLIKKSSGILFLNNANTYSGGTVISNGTVKIGADNALPSTGNGDVALYSPGVIDMNGFSDTINALNGNGTVDVTSGGTSTLTIGDNGDSGTFSGVIQNTSGTLGLFKSGNGTETLTASNSYAGPTTIDTGTLRVTNLYALGSNAVTINSGNLDLATSLIVASINGNGGTIVNNSTATTVTNTLIVQGTSTSGSLISGRLAVLVNGGTLRLNAANTYSGGTIVASGAGLAIGGGAANPGPAGVIASNNVTISQPNTASGSSTFAPPVTTVNGATVTFISSTTANNWGNQFNGSALATNIFANGNMSIGGTYSFSNFLGTVVMSNGTARMGPNTGFMGGDNTTFNFVNGGGMFTRDAGIVRLGALFGNGTITGPSVGTVGTFWIGAKGIDSEYSGTIAGSNNIVKTGVGRLTLDGAVVTINTDSATFTNYIYAPAISYLGSTTVSNGVLALSVPNNLDNSPTITLAASTAVLDAANMGYVTNFNDINSNPDSALITNGVFQVLATTPAGTPQVLAGFGTIKGNGVVSSGAINPGSTGVGGTLSISNSLSINYGATNFFDLSDDLTGVTTPSDLIRVQGDVNLSGSSVIAIGALNGVLKVGTYPLIKYGGNLKNESGVVPSGPISNFALGGVFPATSRATMVLSNAPGEVDLVVVSLNNLNLTWTGDGVSNWWDVVNSFTWTDGVNPIQFYQLDAVAFNDNTTNFTAILQGTLVPSAITVNSSSNYIFGGNGTIGGVGTLIKKGSGTLILTNGANSYTGGTILSNGVLNVGSDSGGNQNDLALGSGPVTVNTGAELRFGGNTGATVVNHLITNAITVNGGVVKAQDGSQHLTNSIVTITANGGTFQTVFATKTLVLDSPVVGTGPLTISVPAGFVGASVVFNNPSNTVSGSVAIATNGVLTLNGSSGLSNSPSIDIQLGGALDTTGRTNRLLTLLSGQTLKGNGTLRGNLTTAAGSTLSPGASAGILGILTVANTTGVTNTATLGGTTIMELNRAVTPNSDRLLTAGTNVFGGTLTVNNIGAALQLNDTFQLFTNAATRGAFAVTNLPSLTSGLGWNNSLAINGRLTVIATANTNPTNITAVVNGNQLTLNWPADHTGWHLQIQTNSLSTGLNTNWVTLPGSDLVNSTNMTINPANGAVFYRMVYP
jgi:autotransporter-associated beta strand protein